MKRGLTDSGYLPCEAAADMGVEVRGRKAGVHAKGLQLVGAGTQLVGQAQRHEHVCRLRLAVSLPLVVCRSILYAGRTLARCHGMKQNFDRTWKL